MRSAGLLFIMARLGECMCKCTGYIYCIHGHGVHVCKYGAGRVLLCLHVLVSQPMGL